MKLLNLVIKVEVPAIVIIVLVILVDQIIFVNVLLMEIVMIINFVQQTVVLGEAVSILTKYVEWTTMVAVNLVVLTQMIRIVLLL